MPAISRLVALQSDTEALRSAPLLAEMRQLEDRFGLNPYARRQLRWTHAATEVEEPAPPASVVSRLRAVDPTGGNAGAVDT